MGEETPAGLAAVVDFGPLSSYSDVLDLVKTFGHPSESLGRTIFGADIIAVKIGGDEGPPILVTAGAHAGEPAGVFAALEIIRSFSSSTPIYVVPVRDPFAWDGFGKCLERVLGFECPVDTHSRAEEVLQEHGTVLHHEPEEGLILSLIADLVFVSMRPPPNTAGPRDIERRLNRLCKEHPDLRDALAGRRACWPTNLREIQGCGDFDRAFSASFTKHGLMADFNRQFTYAYPPAEVELLRRFVDRIRPQLVLDLHEGQGSKFYLWTSRFREGTAERAIAEAILSGAAPESAQRYSLTELATRIDPAVSSRLKEPVPGLILGHVHSALQGSSFEAYCQRFGPAYSFEPGRWKPLAERVADELNGAAAGIAAFERARSPRTAKVPA